MSRRYEVSALTDIGSKSTLACRSSCVQLAGHAASGHAPTEPKLLRSHTDDEPLTKASPLGASASRFSKG